MVVEILIRRFKLAGLMEIVHDYISHIIPHFILLVPDSSSKVE